MLFQCFLTQVVDVLLPHTGIILVTQLALDVLNLLTEEIFTLLLVKVATSLVLNLTLELHELYDIVGKLDGLLKVVLGPGATARGVDIEDVAYAVGVGGIVHKHVAKVA